MLKDENIPDLMVANHVRLEKLVDEFEKANFEVKKELFENLKWEFEKHFFIEEKAVFTFCKAEGDEAIVHDLINEHGLLLNFLSAIEDDLGDSKDVDISEFRELHSKHMEIEDQVLYPKLDETLTSSEKELVKERVARNI